MRQTYGKLLPGMKLSDLAGKLIVIEGTDGAGRTTQINMLKPWLEQLGHAVLDTGMTRSPLAGDGIRRAKEGNNLGASPKACSTPPISSIASKTKSPRPCAPDSWCSPIAISIR